MCLQFVKIGTRVLLRNEIRLTEKNAISMNYENVKPVNTFAPLNFLPFKAGS